MVFTGPKRTCPSSRATMTNNVRTSSNAAYWEINSNEPVGGGLGPPLELLTYNPELLNLLATVFGNIDVPLGIHGDAVRLVEFTREVSGTAETRQNLAALTIDDFDLRVVLVDEVDEPLVRIGREIERHGRAACLCTFPVGWCRVGFPGHFNILFEATHLVVHLYPALLPVANIDQPVVGHCHTVHGLHTLRLPLP